MGRGMGFSELGPITASEIVCWLDLHGIEGQAVREDYYSVISRVDSGYRKWLSEQEREKAKGTKKYRPPRETRERGKGDR